MSKFMDKLIGSREGTQQSFFHDDIHSPVVIAAVPINDAIAWALDLPDLRMVIHHGDDHISKEASSVLYAWQEYLDDPTIVQGKSVILVDPLAVIQDLMHLYVIGCLGREEAYKDHSPGVLLGPGSFKLVFNETETSILKDYMQGLDDMKESLDQMMEEL